MEVCRYQAENPRERHWGVICPSGNGKVRVLGHNSREQGDGQIRTWDRRFLRGLFESRGIRLATLNIRSGRAGGLKADLRALN